MITLASTLTLWFWFFLSSCSRRNCSWRLLRLLAFNLMILKTDGASHKTASVTWSYIIAAYAFNYGLLPSILSMHYAAQASEWDTLSYHLLTTHWMTSFGGWDGTRDCRGCCFINIVWWFCKGYWVRMPWEILQHGHLGLGWNWLERYLLQAWYRRGNDWIHWSICSVTWLGMRCCWQWNIVSTLIGLMSWVLVWQKDLQSIMITIAHTSCGLMFVSLSLQYL